jgi:hypothetical protein
VPKRSVSALDVAGALHGSKSGADPGSGDPPTAKLAPHLPADCFLVWFFLTSFNSFVRIAATDIRLEWVEGKPR